MGTSDTLQEYDNLEQEKKSKSPTRRTCSSRKRKQKSTKQEKLLVILDIDQTLIYSTNKKILGDQKYFTVIDSIINQQLFVYKRPHLQAFLSELQKMSDFIEIAAYTAGTQEYADQVLDKIDLLKTIQYRFYRQDCIFNK